MSGVFAEGEKALFIDSKQRRYLIQLNVEGEFHSHAGFVAHKDVIGTLPGQPIESTKGSKYIVLRPTLEDFVIEMPLADGGAQYVWTGDRWQTAPDHLLCQLPESRIRQCLLKLFYK